MDVDKPEKNLGGDFAEQDGVRQPERQTRAELTEAVDLQKRLEQLGTNRDSTRTMQKL